MTTVAVPVEQRSRLAVQPPLLRALRDYVSLCKPRIVSLLLLTEGMTMVVAARGIPSLPTIVVSLLGGALASGGSGAINCWYDRDIDATMVRTCSRPLPAGRIRPAVALSMGIVLIALATALFAIWINLVAAGLALAGALFYVLIYTMVLKRTTPLNIVIGGAAGAFPPLVGWAAVRGGVGWPALALFAVVFLWTPPHFWSLAVLLRKDYTRAGVPMLPGLIGVAKTHARILRYVVVLIAASLLPGLLLGGGYVIAVSALGGAYLALSAWARLRPSRGAAAALFHYSLLYLALVFVAAAIAAS